VEQKVAPVCTKTVRIDLVQSGSQINILMGSKHSITFSYVQTILLQSSNCMFGNFYLLGVDLWWLLFAFC